MSVEVKGKDLNTYVVDCRKSFEQHLKDLVDIPSVSADPAHKEDMLRCGKRSRLALPQE